MKGGAIIERDYDNPYFNPDHAESQGNPRTVTVQVNTRNCSYLQMHARGQIDTAQLAACERFHGIFYLSGQTGAVAIDYGEQRVDGGKVTDGLPAARVDALGTLQHLSGLLGVLDYPVVCMFAGQGHSVGFIAEKMTGKLPSQREREYYGSRIRDALDILCKHWSLKDKRS